MKSIVSLAGAVLLALSGAPLAAQQVDFKQDILPIIQTRCIECHIEGNIKSGLRMDSRAALLEGGYEGPSVVVGNSADSLLIHLLEGTRDEFDQMPPNSGPLPDAQIALFKAWIDQGLDWPEDAVVHPVLGKVEGLPEDWKVEATAQEGPLAQWALVQDLKGPAGEQAIAVVQAAAPNTATRNLLWTPKASFKNGSFEVKTKAVSGTESGGGIIWRVRDKNNYYVARYDAASKQFSVNKVVHGVESELSATAFEVPADGWVTLKIEQQGDKITAHINEQAPLELTDTTFTEAGGVGYLTKADAASAFAGAKLNPAS